MNSCILLACLPSIKAKIQGRKVQSIFGFFSPEVLGKVAGPGFPSVLFLQKHHLKQNQQIQFPGAAKDFLQPQTLTALKGP